MMASLTDAAWAEICAATERTFDVEVRAFLSTVLFEEYPAFAYDRARVAKALRRAERMLKHLDAFAELYRQARLSRLSRDQLQAMVTGRADAFMPDDVKSECDLWCLRILRSRTEATLLGARAIRRANARRKSVQREWLYHRLCTIWLDHFHAFDLSYSRPAKGGEPYGPLIAFMRAAIQQIMPEDAPSAETMSDAIARERRERENLKQLTLQLRERERRMVD